MIEAFFYGTTLAFGLILPLGMQNIFIFNQGATQPVYIRSLPSVITAFLCDMTLILCAVFGISLIVLTMPLLKNMIFCIGILFLCYMGYATWQSTQNTKQKAEPFSIKKQIWFSATVSLLNPHAILDTIGVIGTNSLYFSGHEKLAFTLACIITSLFWFFGLSFAGHYFKKISKSGYNVVLVNKISALIMWSMAFYLSWQLINTIN